MKVVLYGATGMVGAGVLMECIADPRVTSVLCVGRKPTGVPGANALAAANPTMAFCFVSGAGTDNSGSRSVMWARVKGRAENAVFAMKFRSWAFRPGYIQPMKGVKSKTTWVNAVYTLMAPLYPFFRPFTGNFATTTENVGVAMIHVALNGEEKKVLENGDINRIAAKAKSTK